MTDISPELHTRGDEDTSTPLVMNAQVEKLSDIERKIDVAIPWDQVKGRLDEAYRELANGVAIKGFRKGKVPRKMLERLFGKHVDREVAQRLVQESISRALLDHQLAPVSEPKMELGEIVEGTDFRYTATLQVVPEIDPRDYLGVELRQRAAQVTDDDVDRALRAKQQEHTEFKPIEGRTTQLGDVLLVDLLGKLGTEAFAQENQLVELGAAHREPLPGLAAKLTGIEPTPQELDVELEVPVHDHSHDEPCPGDEKKVKARLLVTVKDVKQKVVPDLDDDFAKDTGEAETLAALRDALRTRLVEADGAKAREECKEQLMKELLKRNEIPVVPALVERHLDRIAQLRAALMGMHSDVEPMGDEEVKERMRGDAEQTVKSVLLLEAIAKKENVEVLETDLDRKLSELATAREQNVAKVRSEYEKKGRLEALKSSIREEKTLDLLLTKANIIKEETVGGSAVSP
ncbi:MAG: trigger factor [Deltaproteobacteria bacterium]|nr:trigger factor [Deltaproteobacteria bacterium]